MSEEVAFHKPWLIAVWPGMGNVALNAGYYLMAKLEMHLFAEFSPRELFEMEHVEVKDGLVHPGHLPRSRLFGWTDPQHLHDIVLFIGEAQPPRGKYLFCHNLIDLAQKLNVERIFTFAAMATEMHPDHFSRVFGAATDESGLEELKSSQIEVIKDGHIGGLNGILLGVAAERGLRGSCLLGEMPHIFVQFPYPKASLAVLRVFSTLAQMDLDTHELAEQARIMDHNLGQLLTRVEHAIQDKRPTDEEPEEFEPEPAAEEQAKLTPQEEQDVDRLFEQARQDRTKAYELKRELDRLNVFTDYEDRFLDLFRKPDEPREQADTGVP